MAQREKIMFARCRACMDICYNLISLKEQVFADRADILVETIIELFFDEKIENTHNLNICGKCFEEAKVAYCFSQKCEKTKNILKTIGNKNVMKPYTNIKVEDSTSTVNPKIEGTNDCGEEDTSVLEFLPVEEDKNRSFSEESIGDLSLKVSDEEDFTRPQPILAETEEEGSESTDSTVVQDILEPNNVIKPLRTSTRFRNTNWTRFEIIHPPPKPRRKKTVDSSDNIATVELLDCKLSEKTVGTKRKFQMDCTVSIEPHQISKKSTSQGGNNTQQAKRDHVCIICNKAFYHRRNMLKHLDIHKNCSLCGMVPMDRKDLKMHIEKTHLYAAIEQARKTGVHQCPFCKDDFQNINTLSKHVRFYCNLELL